MFSLDHGQQAQHKLFPIVFNLMGRSLELTLLPYLLDFQPTIQEDGKEVWRPRRDLNPCYRRERAVSWAGLDDGDAVRFTGRPRDARTFVRRPTSEAAVKVGAGPPGGPGSAETDA